MKRFTPGAAFSDFVILGSASKNSRHGNPRPEIITGDWLWVGILITFSLLLIRLVSLQLFDGGKYRILADENRVKTLIIPAPRGNILDVFGKPLENNPANSAVVGYVGEISPEEVGLLRQDMKYQIKDLIGRAGLQKQYEDSLKGVNGARLVEVDNKGQAVRDLGERKARPGQNLPTSIDASIQKIAFESLNDKKGTVIVSNPNSGEILALVSSPGYDPLKISQSLNDSNLPFFNRAIAGLYPPGSTFKMVTALSALGSEKLNKNFQVEDVGVLTVAGFKYANWFFTEYGGKDGVVDWVKALTRSNDIFFYKAGETTGPEIMAAWAQVMGFGSPTGVDLPGEVEGLVPTPTWKEKFKNEQWFLGNTYHMAIGQGDVLATPLQVNQMTNILATNKKCQLHIANDQMIKPARNAFSIPASNASRSDSGWADAGGCSNVQISTDILDIIRRGMVGACQAGGTAFPFFDWAGPEVACKTGTAEYINEFGKYGTHAWFTIFAPADNPKISVTVLVEGGGEGSRAAAPVARKILSSYFGVEDKFNYGSLVGEGE